MIAVGLRAAHAGGAVYVYDYVLSLGPPSTLADLDGAPDRQVL
ncbi:hypothetical protein EV647_1030 [Kribbella sp. VKM Ac-2566]|nr:hypothetical protein EV647_1030 [Kribbella sp. VKM Ac-2566]